MSVPAMLRAISVDFGDQRVLHDVDLDVEAGKFVTLLGPSGSGKTTTLNVIGGFVEPSSGTVELGGRRVDHLPPQQRDVGYVFQTYALFPHMTVQENVEFPLALRKLPRQQRRSRAKQMLDVVQLAGMESRRVTSLSGGQQQRVALARALAFDPHLLLLDEPLAALDKQLREVMQVELKRIQQEVGVTCIAVTHDQNEALAMSDAVVVMRDGVIEQAGAPETLYERPATVFVAGFLGDANLLEVDDDGMLVGHGSRHPAGRAGTAVIRPEHWRLASDADPADAVRVTAQVRTVSYRGDRYRVAAVVDRQPEQRVLVSLPVDGTTATPEPGARLDLVCDLRRVHLIAAPPPPGVARSLDVMPAVAHGRP